VIFVSIKVVSPYSNFKHSFYFNFVILFGIFMHAFISTCFLFQNFISYKFIINKSEKLNLVI